MFETSQFTRPIDLQLETLLRVRISASSVSLSLCVCVQPLAEFERHGQKKERERMIRSRFNTPHLARASSSSIFSPFLRRRCRSRRRRYRAELLIFSSTKTAVAAVRVVGGRELLQQGKDGAPPSFDVAGPIRTVAPPSGRSFRLPSSSCLLLIYIATTQTFLSDSFVNNKKKDLRKKK